MYMYSTCIEGILYYSIWISLSTQIDQKGPEHKLGQAFQHYVQSVASCLIA